MCHGAHQEQWPWFDIFTWNTHEKEIKIKLKDILLAVRIAAV